MFRIDTPRFWHDVRNSYEVVRDRAELFERKLFAPKMVKRAKNGPCRVFGNY